MKPPPHAIIPYCGAPPTAGTLSARWNLDPLLIGGLAALLLAYLVLTARRERTSSWPRGAFIAGWAVAAAALVSPLCALSVSLFSARVGQHLILAMIAAPLVALGLPGRRWPAAAALPFAGAFALAMWVWHAPGPYRATFASPLVYWAMHLTTFGAALGFWLSLARTPLEHSARAIAAAVATSLQMALLGAVIAFDGRPLYSPHFATTWAWGLTPLQDQQLGGALMWVPAGLVFAAAILLPLYLALRTSPASLATAAAR